MPDDAYRFEEYRPAENPVIVHFTRRDPLFNNTLFYRLLSAFLVVVLLSFVLHAIWLRTFPMLGSLMFVKRDQEGPKEVPLNLARRKRQIVFKGKAIPFDLRADFKRIDALNQPAQGRAPNKRTRIRLGLDEKVSNMTDGQSVMKSEWHIMYTWSQPSKQRDRFALWAVVTTLIAIVVIVLIFVA
jgi:hypothetical protein